METPTPPYCEGCPERRNKIAKIILRNAGTFDPSKSTVEGCNGAVEIQTTQKVPFAGTSKVMASRTVCGQIPLENIRIRYGEKRETLHRIDENSARIEASYLLNNS